MILFFDTETTGKYEFAFPPDDPRQPYIVQLAALLTDDDGKELASLNTIIKPDGFIIPNEAASIHGITTERARQIGVNIDAALAMFFELKKRADVWVAHNIDFDRAVIDSVAERMFLDVGTFEKNRCFCTMLASAPVLKMPNQYGYDTYKWPKLIEAYRHFFGESFDGAHDALADVRACAAVYFKLKKQEVLDAVFTEVQ
jgi:DNA polymerase III subunit epsilon